MRFITLALFAAALYGQTTVKTDQIKAAPGAQIQLLAVGADGKLLRLNVGAGIEVVGNTLSVRAADSTAQVIVSTRLQRDSSGTYTAVSGIVTRNGIVQEAGKDFNVSGTLMIPVTPWAEDDVVLGITLRPPSGVVRLIP